jgi:hypothetical protein
VQHPAGIIMLPEGAPEGQSSGRRVVINGVVQTGLNVARYDDGTTIAAKPVRMRGNVMEAMSAGDAVVLAVDAESRTFVNVLDVASATVRLKKDVKIKGQLAYAELTPAGLLYISRPDAGINAEVNIIDLATGEPRFKDAIESGKPMGSATTMRRDTTCTTWRRAGPSMCSRTATAGSTRSIARTAPSARSAARSSSRAAKTRSRWSSGPRASCSWHPRTWW